jgi:radical SAM protein with 4Fe4S-binding SPASM domain
MIDDIRIDFKDKDLLINKRNKKVILYNKDKKRHIKLSDEVYKYIRLAEKNKWTVKELLDCFKKNEDKKYMSTLIDIMIKNEVILGNILQRDRFKDIHLSLTNRCNLSCKHCVSSCGPKEYDYLDTKKIIRLIDNLCNLNVRTLILTGGEPLVRADFTKIVEYIKEVLPVQSLGLSTNATLINDENIDFIVNNFDKIDISIDGVDENTCSNIRGKGVFGKVMKAIHELHSRDFYNISMSMVFSEKNYGRSKEFKMLNERLNTTPIERYFIPSGRGLVNRDIFSDEDSTLPLLVPRLYEENSHEDETSKIGSCSCNACIEQVFIDHKGDIYPCPSLTEEAYLIGSVFDKDVVASLRDNKLRENTGFKNLNKLYPFNFEKCKDCDVNIFCLKCPARVNTVKDNEKELKRWCGLMKKNIELAIWGGEV